MAEVYISCQPLLPHTRLNLRVIEIEESEYQFKPPTRHHRGKVVAVEWPALAPIAPEEQLILGMYVHVQVYTCII